MSTPFYVVFGAFPYPVVFPLALAQRLCAGGAIPPPSYLGGGFFIPYTLPGGEGDRFNVSYDFAPDGTLRLSSV